MPEAREVRRHELDWMRVLAFGLLIPFHVALAFIPWNPYGFTDPEQGGPFLVFLLLWVHQWRLPLLFLISGMGTVFAMRRWRPAAFARERTLRLGLPLLVGTLFLLPIHSFYLLETLGRGAEAEAGFVQFLLGWWRTTLELPRRALDAPAAPWIHLQHLWFLLNLLLYSFLFLGLVRIAPATFRERSEAALRRLLGWPAGLGLLALALPLVAVEVALKPRAAGNVGTGYEFPLYFATFLYGILLARAGEPFWTALRDARWSATALGTATMASFTWLVLQADAWEGGYGTWVVQGDWTAHGFPLWDRFTAPATILRPVTAWAWVVAFVAWSAHFLSRPSRTLDYLNGAVYPFYIAHMTFVLIGLVTVRPWSVTWPVKFVVVSAVSFGNVMAFYEVIRRWRWSRLLFGARAPKTRLTKELSNGVA